MITSNFDVIPDELKARDQWVTWRYVKRDGKVTKVLYSPATGEPASSTDAQTWGTFVEALAAMRRLGHVGIGYVFASDDPYAGVDLDHCCDKETGEIATWARAIIDTFASYAEISPSGAGVHIIIHASMPGGKGRKRGNYEAYSQGRFFTFTGQHLEGTPATIEERQDELDAFIVQYLPEHKQKRAAQPPQPQGMHNGGILDLSDDAILTTALKDGKFAALWGGDMSGYPSDSEADFALLRKLEFYTLGDADRMDRFFRQSGRMRDKMESSRGDDTLLTYNIQRILDTSTGERASYLHLLKSDAGAPDDEATPEPEPVTIQILRARIVELEAIVATQDATIAQLENDLAGSRDANVRLNREIDALKEYKRSRDEAEERRQKINSLPSEWLSTTDKLVLDNAIRLIRSAQSRGAVRDDGGVHFPLGALVDEYDISTDAASKSVHRLESLGYWTCDLESEFETKIDPDTGKQIGQWYKRLYLLPNEDYLSHPLQAIKAAEVVQAPERNHGGKRMRCEKCNSDDVVTQTLYLCRTCNHEWRSEPRDANPAAQSEETAPDAASPENFRNPQDAGMEQPITILPQVAGSGNNRHSRPAATSAGRSTSPGLCIHEREPHTNPHDFRKPQDAGIAQMPESPERRQQQYDLFQWAKAHDWARLPYAPGMSAGGSEETWGIFLRGSNTHLAKAWAAIAPHVAAS